MKLKKELSNLRKKYNNLSKAKNLVYSEEKVKDLFRQRIYSRPLNIDKTFQRKLNIFFAGTNYNQDNSGILQSLEKIGNVTFAVNEIGNYGLHSSSINGKECLRDDNTVSLNDQLLYNQILRAHEKSKIDILIGQMWANYLSTDILEKIRQMGIIIINIAMDDRLPEHWSSHQGILMGSVGLSSETDLVLCTTKEVCLWYLIEGCPAIYWPLASDPSVFSPDPGIIKDIDVCFVGAKYGVRGEIVEALIKEGVRVEAYGPGWPNGLIDSNKTSNLFRKSKIVLGIGTIGHTKDVFTIKLRDFDVPMTGSFYLTHRNVDLLECFEEGNEIECYSTIKECIAKAKYYIQNDQERQNIAIRGFYRALKNHTWNQRFDQIVQMIKDSYMDSSVS